MGAELADLRTELDELARSAPDGPGLNELDAALIAYAVAAEATALDQAAIRRTGHAAQAAGADPELLVEVLLLVSGIGMHSLHEGVIALLEEHPVHPVAPPESSYWARFEAELPRFTAGLAHWSPAGHRAFLAFGAATLDDARVTRLQRELIYLASDATPTHRYVPGFRFHVDNAVRCGATRRQLAETLAIAARAPAHVGVGRHRALA